MKKILLFIFLFISIISFSQTQIGNDIDGENQFDLLGTSVDLSSDGNIIAVGSTGNNGFIGQVKIFQNSGGFWTQVGGNINGENNQDQFGLRVRMSSDGRIVAISANLGDGPEFNTGHIKVYENIANVWTQIGSKISGDNTADNFGGSLDMNSTGDVIAIGASGSNINGIDSGYVKIFKNINGDWQQIGSTFTGDESYFGLGVSISLNSIGNIVAIGARNNGTSNGLGNVRVFRNIAGVWTQIGSDIQGDEPDSLLGHRVL